MMKTKQMLAVSLLAMAFNLNAFADTKDFSPVFQAKRQQVIQQYIQALGNADAQGITDLFDETGTVISTSRGNVNAKDFFYSFLPSIDSATSSFHQAFISNSDKNHYSARFHFSFRLHDGEVGDGEYVDEFIFADHSLKLKSVYMFENLKFNEPTS